MIQCGVWNRDWLPFLLLFLVAGSARSSDLSVATWSGVEWWGEPVPPGLSDVVELRISSSHFAALHGNGRITVWGGSDTVTWGSVPKFDDVTNAVSIATGHYTTMALLADGSVVRRGFQGPVNYPGHDVRAISVGWFHSLILLRDGTVRVLGNHPREGLPGDYLLEAWGLGAVPQGLSNVVAISAGTYGNMALRADGTVLAWGDTTQPVNHVPEGLRDVVSIDASARHAVAVRADGTVVCWGENLHGQAVPPPDLDRVIAASTGDSHTVALTSDGRIVTWGTFAASGREAPVAPGSSVAIEAGGYYCGALVRSSAPQLRIAPRQTLVATGTEALLYVEALGGALTFQWSKDGVPIPGATAPQYRIPWVQRSHEGRYSVTISNPWGSVTSEAVSLVVFDVLFQTDEPGGGPTITNQMFRFPFHVPGTLRYVRVEVSVDLREWTPVLTNAYGMGRFVFSEPVDPSQSGRYFRVTSSADGITFGPDLGGPVLPPGNETNTPPVIDTNTPPVINTNVPPYLDTNAVGGALSGLRSGSSWLPARDPGAWNPTPSGGGPLRALSPTGRFRPWHGIPSAVP